MSEIVITIDGDDMTSQCLVHETNFEQSMGAEPGTFQITVKDPEQVLSFITGKEVTLDIDGQRQFGGYITQVSMAHFFDADDTQDVNNYTKRKWILRGPDYNIIFDKRIVRNTNNYLEHINLTEQTDGALLRRIVNDYTDMDDYSTTGIEDIADIDGDVIEQGSKVRKWFEAYQTFGGAVWYAGPSKNLIYVPFEDVEKRWGFSDTPNNNPITVSPNEFQGSTIGYRAIEAIEDASAMVNDALVWGGSEWAGPGSVVFAREQHAGSIAEHNRWQLAETHFGERGFKLQEGVDVRADLIVNGPPGATLEGVLKGMRYPQWTINFTWFSDDVPRLSGIADHLIPGDIVPIELAVFDTTKLFPLRSLRISFPGAFESPDPEDHLVQFDGVFGLNPSDPFTLWKYLLRRGTPIINQANIVSVNNDSPASKVGSFYQGAPSPATDGVTTVFTIPFPYIPSLIEVYLNGLLQRRDTDYTESDFETGEFTMVAAPFADDNLWIEARTGAS
jgi:hypothetical protein